MHRFIWRFSIVSIGNQQCSVPIFSNILGHPVFITNKTNTRKKTFHIIIIFCTKVGGDNHNPVKTSNINKPGATPQNFCEVCLIVEPKK